MSKNANQNQRDEADQRIAKAIADAETAKRRATMALAVAKEGLQYCISTPRVGAMIRDIEKELAKD